MEKTLICRQVSQLSYHSSVTQEAKKSLSNVLCGLTCFHSQQTATYSPGTERFCKMKNNRKLNDGKH